MKKIKCLFIDDQEKKIENQINSWEEDFSDEDSSLFQEFSFTFKKSNKKTNANDLMDECMAFDFIILDQMAASDDAGNGLAQAISSNLAGVISYCIYTNETGIDVRKTFKDVNIYKKEEKVTDKFKIEHDCDGGFIDMLKHIKSDTGFNKYCKFLRFTNNQDLEELIRTKLTPLMNNYLESGECKPIDNGHLLKFCEFVSNELVEKEIIPDFADPFPAIKRKTSTIIRYLNFPYEFLNSWLSEDVFWRIPKQMFEEAASKDTKRKIYNGHMNDIFLFRKSKPNKDIYTIGFSPNTSFFDNLGIGDSIDHTLIGQSLNTIWVFRCSDGHKGQEDPNNHALKVVYESILLLSERLSIIFARIDELKKLALVVEEIEPVSEIIEESAEEPKAEETPEAAIEEDEDVIKNVEDEKENKTPSYRNKNINLNIIKKIDLDNL